MATNTELAPPPGFVVEEAPPEGFVLVEQPVAPQAPMEQPLEQPSLAQPDLAQPTPPQELLAPQPPTQAPPQYPAEQPTRGFPTEQPRRETMGERVQRHMAQIEGAPVGTGEVPARDPAKPEDPGALAHFGVGGLQATMGITEGLFKTPSTAKRVLSAITPEDTTSTYFSGMKVLSELFSRVGDPIANWIGKSREMMTSPELAETGLGRTARSMQARSQAADRAMEEAWQNKSLAELWPVLSDSRSWAAFVGQGVPSLVLAIKSGGSLPFIAWLESMEASANAREFEQRTGKKMSDAEFTQAVGQASLINAMLERVGVRGILRAAKGTGPQAEMARSILQRIGNGIAGTGRAAITEAGTEAAQQLNTNLAEMLTYNPEKKILEGVLPSAMGGFGAGAGGRAGVVASRAIEPQVTPEAPTEPQVTPEVVPEAPVAPPEPVVEPPAGFVVEEEVTPERVPERARPTQKKVSEMTPEEMTAALMTSEVTGLPNRRAYYESEQLPVQASIDADSLKWVNDNMSPASGDAMLNKIGEALNEEFGDQAYHFSGDEFMVQGQEDLSPAMQRVQERLKGATLRIRLPDNSIITKTGVEVTYGTGKDKKTADFALKQSKIERGEAGLRATRGRKPLGVVKEVAPRKRDRGNGAAAKVSKKPGTKLYTTPIEPIIKGYRKAAAKVYDFVAARLPGYGALKDLPAQKTYLKERHLTLGKITNVEGITKKISETFRLAGTAEQQSVYEFLTTKNADPNIIKNEKVRTRARAVKRLIDNIGQQLVKKGLMSQEVYEAHRGSYLPRIYLKHLLDEKAIKAVGTGKKPSDMGYLKKRKDIPREIRELILGEITDPSFLATRAIGVAARDIALLDFLDTISHQEDWVFQDSLVEYDGKKVSVYWLKNEADRLRRQLPHYTEEAKAKTQKVIDQMEEIVTPALEKAGQAPEDFKQVPDTMRYGMLRGMYIRKEIYADLIGSGTMMPADVSAAEWLLGHGGVATKATQLWKMSKVALNPPTQVRNFVSNGILLHLSGVPFHMVPARVIQAIQEIRTNGKHWRVAKKHGVAASTFANNEIYRIEREMLALKAKGKGAFSFARIKQLGGIVGSFAGDAYQLSESIFKTAKIIHEMKGGMSESDSVIEAQKWLYDYSLIPESVRYLRNAPVGVPFITFYYKTLPRMLEVAVKNPERFLPYAILPAALAAFIAADNDVDDEDVDTLMKTMPIWLQKKGTAYLLPYKDQHGRWQAVNIEYFLPWSMFTEMAKALSKGDPGGVIEASGVFGGPIPDIVSAIKTNTNSFTKRPIIDRRDPPQEQIYSLMKYVYDLAAPPWITEQGAGGKLYQSIMGEVDPRTGKPKLTPAQAATRFVGVNIYPFHPESERRKNLSRMKYEVDGIKRRMRSQLRDRNLSNEDRTNIRKVYRELIRERMEMMREYMRETKVHPRLK